VVSLDNIQAISEDAQRIAADLGLRRRGGLLVCGASTLVLRSQEEPRTIRPGLTELLMNAEHATTPHHRSYQSGSDDATSQLTAKFAVSAAIAHSLLAQLFFVEAGLPQLSTPCSSAVAITPIAIIVMAIPGPGGWNL
jgi:hypothetical protein